MVTCEGCKHHTPEYDMCSNPKNGLNSRGTAPLRKYTWNARRLITVYAIMFKECGRSGRWFEPKEENTLLQP